MTSQIAQISNPQISVNPSPSLKKYLTNIKICDDVPLGIRSFILKNAPKKEDENIPEVPYLINEDDKTFIKSLDLRTEEDFFSKLSVKPNTTKPGAKLLKLTDLHWLYQYIQKQNSITDKKIYLHEILEGSDIVLPKNEEVPRNEELELRCRKLKATQENREYIKMTKGVDSVKKYHPEDTISYQLKQMNRSLLAIFQFIVSVAAGFVFGFLGIELILGNLDFGFRLLLGIICALVIALAELYFLAKTLNEEVQFETNMNKKLDKNFKLD